MFAESSEVHMRDILELEDKIDGMERQLQHNHVERLTKNECTADARSYIGVGFGIYDVA